MKKKSEFELVRKTKKGTYVLKHKQTGKETRTNSLKVAIKKVGEF